jgi:low affinity Fe/Cu permease
MAVELSRLFADVAHWTARQCGHARVFIMAALSIVVWAILGPVFGFSDTWQLVINTASSIITFLMVFIIQNTQNRDSTAVQLKLDELIRASQDARNTMLLLEDMTEEEQTKLKATFAALVQSPSTVRPGSAAPSSPKPTA